MQLLARPNFFVVKINKDAQRTRKEKEGSLFIVTEDKDEKRNMQCGEIVSIGTVAAEVFPQAKIGHTLILHWLVESKEKQNKFWEDENYNYYHVTAIECHGRPNEAYGVWDGTKIIPNPEYIFLEVPHKPVRASTPEEFIEAATTQTKGGLFIFDEWQVTRTDKEEQMAKINAEIQSLTKTKMSPGVAVGIARKEEELAIISNDINAKRIELYQVAAINPMFNEEIEYSMGRKVEIGDKVGFLNIATQTTLEFMGNEFIIALSKHFHCTEHWIKSSIENFKKIA